MNRKGVREQNDISIIRNLPKRLQKRIVEDVGDESLETVVTNEGQSTGGRPSTSAGVEVSGRDNADKLSAYAGATGSVMQEGVGTDIMRIDYFLQKSNSYVNNGYRNSNKMNGTEPVLEASGNAVNSKRESSEIVESGDGPQNNGSFVGNITIPGILRINDVKQAQLIAAEKIKNTEKRSGRDNGKKLTRSYQLGEQLSKEELATQLTTHPFNGPTIRPLWFEMLVDVRHANQLPKAYEKLISLMQRKLVFQKWAEFTATRRELQEIFAKLLLQQLKLCCEQKVDTFFWKLLYYNVREFFISNSKYFPDVAHDRLLSLIDDGLDFYIDIYEQLNAKYLNAHQPLNTLSAHAINFTPESPNLPSQRTIHKFEFIAKVASQKLLICLGDLCRYKSKELQSKDYTDAAKYYRQAQTLIPTNGIPYNQLAIVALHARKKFDAIYYHMRSLMSSNAIYSARESLLVLFDEIRKKYEETELKTSPVHSSSPKYNNCNTSKSIRKEVWIHVDGVRRLHRANDDYTSGSKYPTFNDDHRFDELSNEELLRRFTSLYLYVIGKLYTGIGMESIVDHQRKLLVQMSVLLSRSTFPITRSRLLKTVALNIFLLEQNMHKESRREIRYYAFNFCNQIFAFLLRKCNVLFEAFNVKMIDRQDPCYVNLNTLLQYINIYTDWLMRNVHIWESVRNKDHIIIDCWSEWECFYVCLKHVLNTVTAKAIAKSTQTFLFEEEVYLLGFTTLTPTTRTTNAYEYLSPKSSNETAHFFARISKIYSFQQCYEDNRLSLIAHENLSFTWEDLKVPMDKGFTPLHSDDDDYNENVVVNGANSCKSLNKINSAKAPIVDAQISQLSKRKKELEAKTNVKKMHNAKLEEILKFVDTKLYIEVHPKYLMPDTNCFIDCLDDFEKLIQEYKRYVLVIPLTVVKELDGLSKGVKVESYEQSLQMNRIHHYDDVSTCAKRSLDFIRSAKNNVKCATTKGSFISSTLFALAEEENVSNDDKILATAIALSKTMSTETTKDGKCFIQTELVLITTDRNLRVKALARNLTVSEMGEFLQWAKDCNT